MNERNVSLVWTAWQATAVPNWSKGKIVPVVSTIAFLQKHILCGFVKQAFYTFLSLFTIDGSTVFP